MRITLFIAAFVFMASGLIAQEPSSSLYIETQAFEDAMRETELVAWSQILIAYSLILVAAIGAFLLANLRTGAFICLVLYGILVMNIPYYVPTVFQRVFGLATIIIGALGLIVRTISLLDTHKRPSTASQANQKAEQ